MSSEDLNNLSNIEDYLSSINKLNVKKKRRTIRLKQCSIRQSNGPRYYRYSLRKVKPIVQRFQIHTEKNTSKSNIITIYTYTANVFYLKISIAFINIFFLNYI